MTENLKLLRRIERLERELEALRTLDHGGGGVTDHGALTGLGDDDHTQYIKEDGSRAFSGDQHFAAEITSEDHIRTDGGIYVGNRAGTIANDNLHVDGAISANGSISTDANVDAGGNVLADDDVRMSGGLVVGSEVANPGAGDARVGGGLYVGSTGSDAATGQIQATSHIRTDGGIYVGNKSGGATTDDLRVDGDVSVGSGLYVGAANQNPASGKIQATDDIVANNGLACGNSGFNPGNSQIIWDARAVDHGLRPWDGGAYYNGTCYVPLQTQITKWSGTNFSGSASNQAFTWSGSVPYWAKALHLILRIQGGPVSSWFSVHPGTGAGQQHHLLTYVPTTGGWAQNNGTVRVNGGYGRDMYYTYSAGTGINVYLFCIGYFL